MINEETKQQWWAEIHLLELSVSPRSLPIVSDALRHFLHRCPFFSHGSQRYFDGAILLNERDGLVELGVTFCAMVIMLDHELEAGAEYDICEGWKKMGTARIMSP